MIAGVITGELSRFHPASVSMRSVWAFVYLIIIGAVVGYTAYIWLLRHCDPAKVATYAYVNPLVAVFLGWAIGGEELTANVGLATVLILGAVAMIAVRRRFPEPQVVSRKDSEKCDDSAEHAAALAKPRLAECEH